MRRLAPWLACCLLSGSSMLSNAAPPVADHVNFVARGITLDRAASVFARLAGLNVGVDPLLSNVRITVSIRHLPPGEAMQAIVEAAQREVPDVLLEEKAGVYRLRLKPGGKVPIQRAQRPEAGTARKINVAFGNVPLAEALELIYRQPGAPAGKAPVQVEPDVPDNPVNLIHSDDAEPALLRIAVRQSATRVRDLRLEEKEGRFTVGIRPNPQREPPPPIRPNLPPPGLTDRRIVLAFRGAPLRYVLQAVLNSVLPSFGPTPEYEINSDVPDVPVTFTLVTASPDQALETTLSEVKKQVRGLNLRKENGKLLFTGPAP